MKASIGAKLFGGFTGIILLMLVVGGVGLFQTYDYSAGYQSLYNNNVVAAVHLSKAENALWQLRYGFPQFMVGDEPARAKILADEPKHYATIDENLKAFEKCTLTDKQKQALAELKEVYGKYVQARPKWFELYGAGKTEEAAAWRAQTTTPFGAGTVKGFGNLIEITQKVAEEHLKVAVSDARKARITLSAVLVIATLFGLTSFLFLSQGITKPIVKASNVLKDISEGDGDLTKRLDVSSGDEIGEMAKYFNSFADKLQDIIMQVSQNASQVTTAADNLRTTANEMASGAEAVANQVSTVATAGEEMAATSSEIAQNCSFAAQNAKQANETACGGAAIVQGTLLGMNKVAEKVRESARTVDSLGARSDQIGQIIGTIEDIADQTNLLALNAAIEAARAGEQGRGFAVVADEVRALAERTTKATREIGEMIKAIQHETKGAVVAMEDGVREVEKGTAEASRSGEALEEIISQIDSVTSQVNQIVLAADQQTNTTGQISGNILSITEVVQSTARGAHESAAAASQLAKLAGDLQGLVRQFKLA